tara:strand:- start:3895 stop:4500 length:606 start_codon:yes stop_codon:yes gene_type:complete
MNLNEYTKYTEPFLRYEFENCFEDTLIDEINNIIQNNEHEKIEDKYDGKRTDNKKRCFIDKNFIDKNKQYIYLQKLIDYLQKDNVIHFFEKIGSIDLKNCYLRVEIILDKHNFWLEKHKDIVEKKVSFLIYINDNDEDLKNGTDLYDKNLKLVHSIPFKHNLGYVFFPNNDTWHGLEKGKNIKYRKCVLINYVTFKTDFKL